MSTYGRWKPTWPGDMNSPNGLETPPGTLVSKSPSVMSHLSVPSTLVS